MNNHASRKPAETSPEIPEKEPFTLLGYDRHDESKCYFLTHSTGRVVCLALDKDSSTEEIKRQLMGLAPLEYWRSKYPARPGQFDSKAAL